MVRPVGALEQDPLGAGLQARFVEQPGGRDARPLRAGEQAMRLLHGGRGRLGPVRQRVAGALQEVEPRDGRIAHQRVHGERQGLLHHAMDDQAMRGRIDVGDAGMMPLEDQPVGRDDAVLILQRRHAPVRPVLAVHQDIGAPSHDVRLERARARRKRSAEWVGPASVRWAESGTARPRPELTPAPASAVPAISAPLRRKPRRVWAPMTTSCEIPSAGDYSRGRRHQQSGDARTASARGISRSDAMRSPGTAPTSPRPSRRA